jgi:hypothetical protein
MRVGVPFFCTSVAVAKTTGKRRGGRRVRKDDGGAKVEAPPTYKELEDA